MKIIFRTLLMAIAALTITATAFAQADAEGSKDYPGIARMPNTFLLTYGYLKFAAFDFPVATVHNQDKTQSVEGEKTFIRYKLKDGAERTSPLQKLRNYENAARAAGGQVVWDYINGAYSAQATLKLHQGSSEIWVYLNASTNDYELTIIARQAMAQPRIRPRKPRRHVPGQPSLSWNRPAAVIAARCGARCRPGGVLPRTGCR